MPLIPRLWNLVINQMKALDIVAVWWLWVFLEVMASTECPFAPSCLVAFVSPGVGKLRRFHSCLLLPWDLPGALVQTWLSPLPGFFFIPREFTSLLLLFPACYFRSAPFLLALLPPGKVGGNPGYKTILAALGLGVCPLPVLSFWSRVQCLRHLAHSVLVSPPTCFLLLPYRWPLFRPNGETCHL